MGRIPLCRLGVSLLLACVFAPLGVAHADGSNLSIEQVRAVRISDSSISLSFVTSDIATATVVYLVPGKETVTLTDSNAQRDHLFTVNELDPLKAYSFSITASNDGVTSNKYVVLLSPATIGDPGQSILPGVEVMDANGVLIAAVAPASTTPVGATRISPWFFVGFAALAFLAWGASFYHRRRTAMQSV